VYVVEHHPSRATTHFSVVIIRWFLRKRTGGHIMHLIAQSFIDSYQVDALDDALRRNPGLHIYLNLDYNRSTRPGPTSPILALLPLLRNHEHRVHVSLFKSPKLSGMTAKIVPPRFNEGWGTWHAKIYGSDDDVMISGLVTL
jgi:phosphatidylserine/phosphatidylglycerophosphate/cardiolipin synthase-like enzyme